MQACNQRSFKINTAESAQPRNHSIITRPFSSWEGRVWASDYFVIANTNTQTEQASQDSATDNDDSNGCW